MAEFILHATPRDDYGRRFSRRLRRDGMIPAVIYGGGAPARSITIEHREIMHLLRDERVYSSLIKLEMGETSETVVLRDLQRHPFKPVILHADLQLASGSDRVHVHVPIHFVGEEQCVGVKLGGGKLHHDLAEVEIEAPANALMEFIEVDVSTLEKGHSYYLSDIKLPEGVEFLPLKHGDDKVVVSVSGSAGGSAGDEEESTEEGAE